MSADPDNIVDLHNLQADQPVYTSDGKQLGDVAGITIDLETGEPYLEVMGSVLPAVLGGKHYFIPKRAIAYAVIGQPVRLKVSSEEAEEHFTVKPRVI
jgi:sporulation protein YlmC with PRC-barrel domain